MKLNLKTNILVGLTCFPLGIFGAIFIRKLVLKFSRCGSGGEKKRARERERERKEEGKEATEVKLTPV